MKEIDGSIDILVGQESTVINIYDKTAATLFCKVKLTSNQLSTALSRLSHTPCESVAVYGLDRLGKKHENKSHTFELPQTCSFSERKRIAVAISKKTCPEGWSADSYFDSQDSFYESNGKLYAKCTIRRWV